MNHFLSVAEQRLVAAFIGSLAGSVVAYLKLRALILIKHEELKLHVTKAVQDAKAGES